MICIDETTSLMAFLSPLFSTTNLNRACSNCNVIIGSNKEVYVIIRSTAPYSSVLKIPVYTGNKRKLTSWVQILPIDIIAVFFANSLALVSVSLTPSINKTTVIKICTIFIYRALITIRAKLWVKSISSIF